MKELDRIREKMCELELRASLPEHLKKEQPAETTDHMRSRSYVNFGAVEDNVVYDPRLTLMKNRGEKMK